jgi:hypothetical protein
LQEIKIPNEKIIINVFFIRSVIYWDITTKIIPVERIDSSRKSLLREFS